MSGVFGEYGSWEGWALSRVTHMEGSPWWQAKQAGLEAIPDELTRAYYHRLSQRSKGEGSAPHA